MSGQKLSKAAIAGLIDVRRSMPKGLRIYPGPGFFCSGSSMQATVFRQLAGHGLVNVVDRQILITEAGAALIDGLP